MTLAREVVNRTRKLLYFDAESETLVDSHTALHPERLRAIDFDKFLDNGFYGWRRPGDIHLISGLAAIPPRTRWIFDGALIRFHSTLAHATSNTPSTARSIDRVITQYLAVAERKSIGVELSGGLDTSLIIEHLIALGVDIGLIAFTSDAYNFRTERYIQNIYLSRISRNIALRYEEHPAYAKLAETPLHPLPTIYSAYHSRHAAAAEAARSINIRTLLNGEAGDYLFATDFTVISDRDLSSTFNRWNLSDHWINDTIYAPQGVEYVSAFSLNGILAHLLAHRRREKADPHKLSTRSSQAAILPAELTAYAYKASHDNWVYEGLHMAGPELQLIRESAFNATGRRPLSPKALIRDAQNFMFLNRAAQQQFIMRCVFAAWVHAFNRHGLL